MLLHAATLKARRFFAHKSRKQPKTFCVLFLPYCYGVNKVVIQEIKKLVLRGCTHIMNNLNINYLHRHLKVAGYQVNDIHDFLQVAILF